MDLAPVVTNLAAPSDVWVRVEGVALFRGQDPAAWRGARRPDRRRYSRFMRTQTLRKYRASPDSCILRQDLNERVATRSQGQVREFIIRTLVVQ